jgi:hypothetical protein
MQCPHCLVHIHDGWNYFLFAGDIEGDWGIGHMNCPDCKRVIVALGKMRTFQGGGGGIQHAADPPSFKLVYPKTSSRSPVPPEVPAEFAEDYREACLVLADSEKASAALSRRCLQHLLHDKIGIKEHSLSAEIDKLLKSKQLPSALAEELDAIRNVGNFAAHPLKDTNTGQVVEVEPEEAEWLLNVLEGLFDFYFVQPERSKARQAALNAKLKSAGKPPMKSPTP